MTSTFTSGRAHLDKPANGDSVDTWNLPVNSNSDIIDNCISLSINVTLSIGNVNLTQTQMQCQRIALIGAMTGNASITFLSTQQGLYLISNATSGNFNVSLISSSGTPFVLSPATQTTSFLVYVDGANAFLSDDGNIIRVVAASFVPPGAIMDFGMSTPPTGWLVCDGSAVSRTGATLALFNNIGTTWGVGNGSTTFNLPDFRGQFRRGWDSGAGVDPARVFASSQTDEFKQHNHGITEPNGGLGHKHDIKESLGANASTPLNSVPNGTGSPIASTEYATTGIIINNAGTATETRPKNYAVLTCIKT